MANSIFIGAFGTISGTTLILGSATLSVSHKVAVTDVNGEIVVGNDGFIYWSTRTVFTSPADAQLNITNGAVGIGIGLDVGTDAILKVRTRAQTGYATVDALAYKASGVAGVTFGPSAVASLTIVGGIVTAAS